MRRVFTLLPALFAVCVGGCAVFQKPSPFHEPATAMTRAQARNTKSGPNRDAARSDQKAESSSDSRSSSGAPLATSANKPPQPDDQSLKAVVERELQDAPVEERTAILAELEHKSEAEVRALLRMRRLQIGLQKRQKRNSVDDPLGKAPEIDLAGASPRPPLTRRDGELQPVGYREERANRRVPQADQVTESSVASLPAAEAGAARLPDTEIAAAAEADDGSTANSRFRMPKISLPDSSRLTQALSPAGLKDAAVAAGLPLSGRGSTAALEVPLAPGPWTESIAFQQLIDLAAREVADLKPGTSQAEQQEYLRKHAYLRMLYMIRGQAERAVEAIPGVAAADQMFWQQTLWAMHNYFDTVNIPAEGDRATQAVQQISLAAQRLQEKAHLQLKNACFCQQIWSYGTYERFPQFEFSPGQQVLLYTEVENFHSEEADGGAQFRTILKSNLEIYRAGSPGDPEKIQLPVPATEDLCRNRRKDYFHTYDFVIPQRLSAGPHVLRLTVEDTLTHKVATATINFTVR